jgi:hypothetical protein
MLSPGSTSSALAERIVIRPVGDCSWEDVNKNGEGHRTCINTVLGDLLLVAIPQHC